MDSLFGQTLRELRRRSALSQRQLAKDVGVDFSYVSKLENDRLPAPSAETIERFARVLGTTPDVLLAAARKLPGAIGEEVVREPAAQRFLRTASTMKLSGSEWEKLIGKLENLRDDDKQSGKQP